MIRIIKRYESRKLYDTEESRYISLEDIAKWVRDGQEVQVIDNASSDDVTPQILTQIILEEGKRGTSFLPSELLHELIRAGEQAVQNGVDRVQGGVDRLLQASIDRFAPVRRAREEMTHLRHRLTELEKTLSSLEEEREDEPAKPATRSTKSAPRKAKASASGARTSGKTARARRPRKKASSTSPAEADSKK